MCVNWWKISRGLGLSIGTRCGWVGGRGRPFQPDRHGFLRNFWDFRWKFWPGVDLGKGWALSPENFYHPRMRRDNPRFIACVCNAPTLEGIDLGSSFLVSRYIFRISRSNSYIKVIGSRSRSQKQESMSAYRSCSRVVYLRLKGNLSLHTYLQFVSVVFLSFSVLLLLSIFYLTGERMS